MRNENNTGKRKYWVNSSVEGTEVKDKGNLVEYNKDVRGLKNLMDDRNVKWFDGIACTGVTIDQSFLQKDLERIEIDGIKFSEYVRGLEEGQVISLYFTHRDPGVIHRVLTEMFVNRCEHGNYFPCILTFKTIWMKQEIGA